MLEIFAVMMLANHNAKKAAERGRNPGPFKTITYVLWFGCEILGLILGAGVIGDMTAGYFFALLAGCGGGLASYLLALNCAPGNFRQMQYSPPEGALPLDYPCILTVSRLSSAVGAMAVYSVLLNGQPIGNLRRGESVQIPLNLTQNVIVAKDSLGNELKPLYFSVPSGGSAWICFNTRKFLPENSGGITVISDAVIALMMQKQHTQQQYPDTGSFTGFENNYQMQGASSSSQYSQDPYPQFSQQPGFDAQYQQYTEHSPQTAERDKYDRLFLISAVINLLTGGMLFIAALATYIDEGMWSAVPFFAGTVLGAFLLAMSFLVFRHCFSRTFRVHKSILIIQAAAAVLMTVLFISLLLDSF